MINEERYVKCMYIYISFTLRPVHCAPPSLFFGVAFPRDVQKLAFHISYRGMGRKWRLMWKKSIFIATVKTPVRPPIRVGQSEPDWPARTDQLGARSVRAGHCTADTRRMTSASLHGADELISSSVASPGFLCQGTSITVHAVKYVQCQTLAVTNDP